MRKRVIGSHETYRTKTAAEMAAGVFRMTLLDNSTKAKTMAGTSANQEPMARALAGIEISIAK
jgi:hypothetical protein